MAENASTSSASSGSTAPAAPSIKAKMLKAVGNGATALDFNAETRTLVTEQGGKYQMSADGKKLKHLMGPAPVGGEKDDK